MPYKSRGTNCALYKLKDEDVPQHCHEKPAMTKDSFYLFIYLLFCLPGSHRGACLPALAGWQELRLLPACLDWLAGVRAPACLPACLPQLAGWSCSPSLSALADWLESRPLPACLPQLADWSPNPCLPASVSWLSCITVSVLLSGSLYLQQFFGIWLVIA